MGLGTNVNAATGKMEGFACWRAVLFGDLSVIE